MKRKSHRMKLLIIGGTRFVGPYFIEDALARGHQVTVFTRGMQKRDLPSQVERLYGNRDVDLTPLKGRAWDAVIDTCGYVPRVVQMSAELLRDRVEHYTFISSNGVYEHPIAPGSDETAPVQTIADETTENVAEHYGALKVLCERMIESYFPGRAFHVRAGLVIGPNDFTDRFSYWTRRIAEGGEVLAPGHLDNPVQFIDARDLAEWMLRMVEARAAGVYSATGPEYRLTLGDILNRIRTTLGSDARFTWVGDDLLLRHDIVPYQEMPLWLPGETNNLHTLNISKVIESGLTFRPLEVTIRDTHAWDMGRSDAERVGTLSGGRAQTALTRTKEAELLREWSVQS